MRKISDAREIVNGVVDKVMDMLYSRGLSNGYRAVQITMAVLCKAKGECRVLTHVDKELAPYDIKPLDIDQYVNRIREACGTHINKVLPQSAEYMLGKYEASLIMGQYMQPIELTQLVHRLMKARGVRRVYNPFAGYASYGIADFIERYYAQEWDHATSNIARMRLYLNDISDSDFEEGDSVREWNEHDTDCIVSTPPFLGLIDKDLMNELHVRHFEQYLISRFVSGSAQYGYFVVTRLICSNEDSTSFDLRKTISEKNLLDMVIDLPAGIFPNTGVSTSLLVLNRQREKQDDVTFINAENCFAMINHKHRYLDTDAVMQLIEAESDNKVIRVKYGQLFRQDCSFSFYRYVVQRLEPKEGQQIITLGEVLTRDPGRQISFRENITFKGGVVDSSAFVDDINKLPAVLGRAPVQGRMYKYHGPHLVINMQGRVYVHKTDTDFYLSPALNKFVFTVNTNVVDVEYLAHVILSNRYIQENLSGGLMRWLNVKVLLRCQVVIDSLLRQQQQIIGRIKRHYLQNEKKRLGIREAGGDLSHMIGAPKDSIGNMIELLLDSDHLSEDERGWVKAIDDNFNYALRLINTVGADFSSLDIEKEEICMAEFLSDYLRSLKNLKMANCCEIISHIAIDKDVTVIGDKDMIRVILDTAFRNAYTHGFSQRYASGNKVLFECKAVDYNGAAFVCLRIANNGNPLERGFTREDFAANGKGAGKLGNTGKGGYHIYSITKKHDGYINLTLSKEWSFILDVLLPLQQASNEVDILEAYGDKCI